MTTKKISIFLLIGFILGLLCWGVPDLIAKFNEPKMSKQEFEGSITQLEKLFVPDKVEDRDISFIAGMSNQQLVEVSSKFTGFAFLGAVDNILTARHIEAIDRFNRSSARASNVIIGLTILLGFIAFFQLFRKN
jgi:hypothetical protein